MIQSKRGVVDTFLLVWVGVEAGRACNKATPNMLCHIYFKGLRLWCLNWRNQRLTTQMYKQLGLLPPTHVISSPRVPLLVGASNSALLMF